MLTLALILTGCAKYNTYYNAKKTFDEAERAREEQIKKGEEVSKANGSQKAAYENAYKKAQKVLDEYPGHELTDDALFLQGKASQRLNNYRNSIVKLDLLFTNFPQTPYTEEALFLQGVNYLMVGEAQRSRDILDLLKKRFPDTRFESQALRTSGDNAYALEAWAEARDAYRDYLQERPDDDGAEEIGLRLATAHWKLHEYAEAAEVLQKVVEKAGTDERSFNARLLLARCRTRLGEMAAADALLGPLREEAEVYAKQGNVVIASAENLLAGDDADGAAALLENMPAEWGLRDVKAAAADMLAGIYLKKGRLDEARQKYQEAVPGGVLLEDVDESKRLLKTIQDYLAAENALPDAPPEKAARLRLLQANALLFGFERPREALDVYMSVAADSAADSTVAPRALYGAVTVYERLSLPDSAQIYTQELTTRFPDSAQAYEVEHGAATDLLTFLIAKQELQVEAHRPTDDSDDAQGLPPSRPGRGTGLRRQTMYLQRRPHVVYPPPPTATRPGAEPPRAARALPADRSTVPAGSAPADTAGAPAPRVDSFLTPMEPGNPVGIVPVPADSAAAALVDSLLQAAPADTAQVLPKAEEDAKAKKKKKGGNIF